MGRLLLRLWNHLSVLQHILVDMQASSKPQAIPQTFPLTFPPTLSHTLAHTFAHR